MTEDVSKKKAVMEAIGNLIENCYLHKIDPECSIRSDDTDNVNKIVGAVSSVFSDMPDDEEISAIWAEEPIPDVEHYGMLAGLINANATKIEIVAELTNAPFKNRTYVLRNFIRFDEDFNRDDVEISDVYKCVRSIKYSKDGVSDNMFAPADDVLEKRIRFGAIPMIMWHLTSSIASVLVYESEADDSGKRNFIVKFLYRLNCGRSNPVIFTGPIRSSDKDDNAQKIFDAIMKIDKLRKHVESSNGLSHEEFEKGMEEIVDTMDDMPEGVKNNPYIKGVMEHFKKRAEEKKKPSIDKFKTRNRNGQGSNVAVLGFDHPPTPEELRKAISQAAGVPEDMLFGVTESIAKDLQRREYSDEDYDYDYDSPDQFSSRKAMLNRVMTENGCPPAYRTKSGRMLCIHDKKDKPGCKVCIEHPNFHKLIADDISDYVKQSPYAESRPEYKTKLDDMFAEVARYIDGVKKYKNVNFIRYGYITSDEQLQRLLIDKVTAYDYYDEKTKKSYTGICESDTLESVTKLFDLHGKLVKVNLPIQDFRRPDTKGNRIDMNRIKRIKTGIVFKNIIKYAVDIKGKEVPGTRTVTSLIGIIYR